MCLPMVFLSDFLRSHHHKQVVTWLALRLSIQGCDLNAFVWWPGVQRPALAHVHRYTLSDQQVLVLGQNEGRRSLG